MLWTEKTVVKERAIEKAKTMKMTTRMGREIEQWLALPSL